MKQVNKLSDGIYRTVNNRSISVKNGKALLKNRDNTFSIIDSKTIEDVVLYITFSKKQSKQFDNVYYLSSF